MPAQPLDAHITGSRGPFTARRNASSLMLRDPGLEEVRDVEVHQTTYKWQFLCATEESMNVDAPSQLQGIAPPVRGTTVRTTSSSRLKVDATL